MRKTLLQTLMDRDDLSRTEAEQVINEISTMVYEAIENGDFFGAEEIFTGELGLEPDYMDDILL